MVDFTLDELEKYRQWAESFKKPEELALDDALEALRQKQAISELTSRGERAAGKALGTLGEVAKGVEKISPAPAISPAQASAQVFEEAPKVSMLGRLAKYIPAVGLGAASYETLKGDVVEGALTGTETFLGMAAPKLAAPLELLRPTKMMGEEEARASEVGVSIPREERLKRERERDIKADLKRRGLADESVFSKEGTNVQSVTAAPVQNGTPVVPEIKSVKEQKAAPVTKSSVSSGVGEKESPEAKLSEAIKAESEQAKKTEMDFTEMLRMAQESRNKSQLLANIGKASELFATGLTGVVPMGKVTKPVSQEFYDKLIKQAEQPVQDVGDMYTMKTKQDEMQRLARRRDPSSDESKFARDLLKQQGITVPEQATAEALEKYAPQLTNILNQREAREARKQELQIRMADIASRKDLTKDQKQETFIQSLRKETTSGALGKLFSNFNTTKKIQKALLEFEKDPSGYTDYATLMGGLKALQGDESVVREAEIRLGMNAASLAQKVENWTNQLITGKSLGKEQRKEIIKAVRVLSDTARNQYKEAIQPIINQAESLDIDTSKLVGEGLLDNSSIKAELPTKRADVQAYADDHFKGDYNKAQQFLKNSGQL